MLSPLSAFLVCLPPIPSSSLGATLATSASWSPSTLSLSWVGYLYSFPASSGSDSSLTIKKLKIEREGSSPRGVAGVGRGWESALVPLGNKTSSGQHREGDIQSRPMTEVEVRGRSLPDS